MDANVTILTLHAFEQHVFSLPTFLKNRIAFTFRG